MRYFLMIIFVSSFYACSTWKKAPLSKNKVWIDLWHNACPDSQGKGQLFVGKKLYSYSYESVMQKEIQAWVMAIEVPLRAEETLVVYDDVKKNLEGSMINYWLTENKSAASARVLKDWQTLWVEVLDFLKSRKAWAVGAWSKCDSQGGEQCQGKQQNVAWSYSYDQISVKNQRQGSELQWEFKRKSDSPFFTQQVVTIRHQKISQTISLQLYPTTCGE